MFPLLPFYSISILNPTLHKGVKANVQLKSNILIGAKVEIIPKGFTLGNKVKIEKIILIYCNLLLNVKLYGLLLALRKKMGYKFWKPICNPWGHCSSIY